MAREHRIQMLQHHILALQNELERVQAGDEATEENPMQLMERLQQEYLDSLQAAASCWDFNTAIRKGMFSFGTWSFGKVLPHCLG